MGQHSRNLERENTTEWLQSGGTPELIQLQAPAVGWVPTSRSGTRTRSKPALNASGDGAISVAFG